MKLLAITVLAPLLLSACSGEKSASEYLEEAMNHRAAGNITAALIEGRNSVRLDPESAEARSLIGELELLSGNAANSEKQLLKAIELGVPKSELTLWLSTAFLHQNKFKELLSLDADALPASDKATVLANKSYASLSTRNRDNAVALAASALKADPASPSALTMNARIQADDYNLTEARTFLSKALEISPDYSEGWELLGDIEGAELRFSDAVTAYSKAVDSARNQLPALIKRAQANMSLKQYSEVQSDLKILNKSGVKLPVLNLMRSEILFSERKFLEAQTELELALKQDPDSASVARNLAVTHLMLGNLGQAGQYGKQYLSAGNSDDSRVLLATIRLQQDRFEQTKEALQPMADAGRLTAFGSRLMSTSHLKLGEIDKAVTTMLELYATLVKTGATEFPDLALLEMPSEALSSELNISPNTNGAAEQNYLKRENQSLVTAVRHLAEGKTDEAMAEAEKLLTADPDNPALLGLIGRVYLTKNDTKAASLNFQKAVDLAESADSSSIMLTLLHLNEGDIQSARSTLIAALDKSSGTTRQQLLMNLAALDESEGNTTQMLTWLQLAIEENPQSYLPTITLASYFARQSEHSTVINTLSSLSETSQRNTQVAALVAQAHIALNEFDQAIKVLSAMLRQEPDSPNWRYLRANAQAGKGDTKAAKADLAAALRIDPDHAPSLLAKTNYDIEANNLELAGEQLTRLEELIPNAPALNTIAVKLNGQIQGTPSSDEATATSETVLNAARTLWNENRRDDAFSVMTGWLAENPDDIPVLLALGNTYIATNKEIEAIETFNSVLTYEPDNFIALNNLAWQLRNREPEAAVGHATAALALQPDNIAILDTLAVIHLGQGNLDEAEKALRTIQSFSPTDPSIQFNGAKIEAALGNRNAAKRMLKPIIEGAINFPDAKKARELYDSL